MTRAAFILIATVALAASAIGNAPADAGSVQGSSSDGSDIIPGRYIISLRDGVNSDLFASTNERALDFRADAVYQHALSGFAANLSPRALAALQADPNVVSVEPDRLVTLDVQTLPTGINRIDADENTTAAIGGPLQIRFQTPLTGVSVMSPRHRDA